MKRSFPMNHWRMEKAIRTAQAADSQTAKPAQRTKGGGETIAFVSPPSVRAIF